MEPGSEKMGPVLSGWSLFIPNSEKLCFELLSAAKIEQADGKLPLSSGSADRRACRYF